MYVQYIVCIFMEYILFVLQCLVFVIFFHKWDSFILLRKKRI